MVAVYPVTSAYHARDSTCHAHSLAFVKFEVPFLPIDPVPGVDEVTHAHTYMYKNKIFIIFNILMAKCNSNTRVTPHVH